jgi:NADPH:quinone reductase-like Zn-dependent oxidoreductase
MKAYLLNGYGGPEKAALGEINEPQPGPRDILVKVMAAGLNPLDFKIRQGALRMVQPFKLPIVLGSECAGVVEAVGIEVTRLKAGDRVFLRCEKNRMGAFAEMVAADESVTALMPGNLDFTSAAAVPLAALTALQVLRDELKIKRGDKIFISGGAGGVGTFAIQIATWLGANVTTTASPRGAELVRSLGADQVIDYTSQDFSKEIKDMDGAFDLIGGETLMKTFGVVRAGGKVVSIAGSPEPETARQDLRLGAHMSALFWLVSFKTRMAARRASVSYRFYLMHPSGADLELLAGLIDKGTVKVVMDRVFGLDEVGEAFEYLEAGRAKGKVVVSLSRP